MNKPFPTECLGEVTRSGPFEPAGSWLGGRRGLINHVTDSWSRDIGPTRLSIHHSLDRARCAACESGGLNRVRNLSIEHDAHLDQLTILGILRGVGYGLRANAFRPTSLAAGSL